MSDAPVTTDDTQEDGAEEVPYPYNIFPRNELRRVLGNLPAPHSQEVLDENWRVRSELWADEPVNPAPYPTSRTLSELKAMLDADAASFQGARTQFASQPQIGPIEGPNYTERHIAQALTDLIDLGYAIENSDGSFSMTTKGHEALQA